MKAKKLEWAIYNEGTMSEHLRPTNVNLEIKIYRWDCLWLPNKPQVWRIEVLCLHLPDCNTREEAITAAQTYVDDLFLSLIDTSEQA
jgi:hypothetical protein